MKRIFTFLIAALLTSTLWAQSPEKMSYQAVIRDADDNLVTNQSVGIRISILEGSASGTAIYSENQTPSTNANGLVSIEIGTGTTSDVFSSIDWTSGPYFIKTETDPTGGTSYSITGTSQLLSVPYALHAKTAETLTGTIIETDPSFTAWDKSTGISITESQITNLQSYLTVEADGDTTNEIQSLSINSNSLSISGGNTIKVPSPLWSNNGDSIYYNGNVGIGTSTPNGLFEVAGFMFGGPMGSLNIPNQNFVVGGSMPSFPKSDFVHNAIWSSTGAPWAKPMIYRSHRYPDNGTGKFPFNQYGELIIQGTSHGEHLNYGLYNMGISFVTWDGIETNEPSIRLRIKENGNVGIGTITPARKLHVSEAIRLEPQASAPSNPEQGDIYFGTDGKVHIYNGSAWYSLDMTID